MFKNIKELEIKIEKLEKVVGKNKEIKEAKETSTNLFTNMYEALIRPYGYSKPETLVEKYDDLLNRHNNLKKDFEELDNKFDHLERFLKIEFFKQKTDVQVYDWASTDEKEGFRATKSYDEVKKAKEVPSITCDCCDED